MLKGQWSRYDISSLSRGQFGFFFPFRITEILNYLLGKFGANFPLECDMQQS
jgi:hypothetical protein